MASLPRTNKTTGPIGFPFPDIPRKRRIPAQRRVRPLVACAISVTTSVSGATPCVTQSSSRTDRLRQPDHLLTVTSRPHDIEVRRIERRVMRDEILDVSIALRKQVPVRHECGPGKRLLRMRETEHACPARSLLHPLERLGGGTPRGICAGAARCIRPARSAGQSAAALRSSTPAHSPLRRRSRRDSVGSPCSLRAHPSSRIMFRPASVAALAPSGENGIAPSPSGPLRCNRRRRIAMRVHSSGPVN